MDGRARRQSRPDLQGEARELLHSLRSSLASVAALSAAGELHRSAAARSLAASVKEGGGGLCAVGDGGQSVDEADAAHGFNGCFAAQVRAEFAAHFADVNIQAAVG